MPELVKTMALEKILHNRHIISIACGSKHCCVVCQSGDVFTWGLGSNGRLGLANHQEQSNQIVMQSNNNNNSNKDKNVNVNKFYVDKPHLVMSFMGKNVVQIECGDSHTLARTSEGNVYSFGNGLNGRLGLGHTRDQWEPKLISKFNTIKLASTSSKLLFPSFSKMIGVGVSSGSNNTANNKKKDKTNVFVLKKTNKIIAAKIACGFRHSIIVDRENGFIYAFGYGGNGELAQGSILKDIQTPTVLHSDFTSKWKCKELSCGGQHTLAICQRSLFAATASSTTDGNSDDGNSKNNNNSNNDDDDDDTVHERNVLFSWGRGLEGQLGIAGISTSVPQQITLPGLEDDDAIVQIACGEYHSVVMTKKGLVWTFGQNTSGNLGLGHFRDTKYPTLMKAFQKGKFKNKSVITIKCSTSFTLFLCGDMEYYSDKRHEAQMDSPTNTVLEKLNNSTDNMLIDGMEEDGGTSNNEEDIEEMIHITASSSNDFNTPINPGGNNQKEVEKNFQVWEKKILPQWENSLKRNVNYMTLLRKYMFIGIPQTLRGRVWKLAIGNRLKITKKLFEMLQKENNMANENDKNRMLATSTMIGTNSFSSSFATTLGNDLPRTFAKLGLFGEQGAFHSELKEILEIYCKYRPDIGYVQGMSYIAALLCLYMPDTFSAFTCLANLLVSEHLFAFFMLDVNAISSHYPIFQSALEATTKSISKKFNELKIVPELYLFGWFQTLFARVLPLCVTSRVWDCFLLDGFPLLFRIGLCIILLLKPKLKLANTFEECYAIVNRKGEQNEAIWNDLITEKALFSKLKDIHIPKKNQIEITNLLSSRMH